ncbi:hypothetical protein HRbin33_01195 [bacterium HR33]|nr:hypothetical protein HRbin33_01195 [bacterium HR33]
MTSLAAFGAAGLLALAGWRIGWLTPGGAAAGWLIGGTVFWRAGPVGAVLLGTFFISANLLGNLRARGGRKRTAATRDARQVLANGTWAALGTLILPAAPALGWATFAGALNAAQADTWATELGIARSATARLITSGRPVPAGTSGAVTLAGTLGGVSGAILLSGIAFSLGLSLSLASGALLGGIAGMLADSLLGATAQGRFYCEVCQAISERRRHLCGRTGRWEGGLRWLDNDGVNFLATAVGAATAVAWARLW